MRRRQRPGDAQLKSLLSCSSAPWICSTQTSPSRKSSLWERTSFRGGEFLHFAAGPVPSAVGDHHLQLVVAVREQPGHGAPVAISRKTHKLPFFGDPQVLQQAAVSPEIGLQEIGRPGEAFFRLITGFWCF